MKRRETLRQRGEGKIGCLFFVVLLVSFVFIALKTVPVYMDKVNFEDSMARLASKAGVENWPNHTINENIKALARSKAFDLNGSDITIVRAARIQPVPEIKISVNYRRQVTFPGYVHVFHFQTKVSSFIGRL